LFEDARERLRLATELAAIADHASRPGLLLHGQLIQWWAFLELGQLAECQLVADKHRCLAECLKHPRHRLNAEMMSAVSAVIAGDLEDACARARRSIRVGEGVGELIVWPQAGCVLLSIVRAAESSDAAISLWPEIRVAGVKTLEFAPAFLPWRLIMISVAHHLGDTETAAREFWRIAQMGLELVNRDFNYVGTLGELAHLAALVGNGESRQYYQALYAALLPYGGTHAATTFGYFGPVHHSLPNFQVFWATKPRSSRI